MGRGRIISVLMLFFVLSFISAQCNDGQIDINSASLEDMMKIRGLGGEGIIAGRVIERRPFNSIDELIDVSGIGNVTLEKIKSQGLACVSFNETGEEESIEEPIQNNTLSVQQLAPNENEEIDRIKKPITSEMILLTPKNPKDIKTNNNVLTSDSIAIYGLLGFCILLGILFTARKIKKPRTEFEK